MVQTATGIAVDPKTGATYPITVRSSVVTWGDANTIVQKLHASSGKTLSVGASGIDETTTTAGLQALFKILLDALMTARGGAIATPASTLNLNIQAQQPPTPPVPFSDPHPQADPRGNLPPATKP